MLPTSARLLRLLSLLQARRFWPGADLADRLEVTPRTLRRDVDKLRELGYPVNAASGRAGGYQLGAGAALPPLLLDDDEALAVTLGLRTAASGSVTGIEEAAVRALAKLEQVMPARLRKRVHALGAAVRPLYRTAPTIDPMLLTTIASACRSQQELCFGYADLRARTSNRTVEPHGLVHTGARWYLVAWDVDKSAFRTFRVDRIGARPTLGRRFLPRPIPDGDVETFVSRSVSSNVYTYQAKIVMHAPIEVMREKMPPTHGVLKPIDAERCLLETGAHSLESLGLYIALLGVEFEVQEPSELIAHLRTVAGRLTRASTRA